MQGATVLLLHALCLLTISPAMAERYAGEFTVTAYCSCQKCCGRGARGLTASGEHVRRGMIAADWGILPRGTQVQLSALPGRSFVVEDTGSAIVDRRIDVWFPTHSLACKFGIRRGIRVWVLSKPGASASGPALAQSGTPR